MSIPWHCSVIIEVEADNKEDAKDKALLAAHPSLCHQCSGQIQLEDANMDIEPDVCEL